MEDRAAEEKQKALAAEAKATKLQAKNKILNDDNTQLRQILQQIQVSRMATLEIHWCIVGRRSLVVVAADAAAARTPPSM